VGRRHLHHAGAELAVDVFVGDDGDVAVHQRQLHRLADQVAVALVFRVHHHGDVAQHGLRPRGGHRQVARAIRQRIADVPEEAVFLLALHFEVADGRLQLRVPVHQPLAAVDQALLGTAARRSA
jgi:hypothetical protein